MAIGLIAKLKIQPGKNESFERAFAEIQAEVNQDPGCNFYACHRTDDPNVYIVLEQYKDKAALDAHGQQMKVLGQKLAGLMAGGAEIERYESIAG
ncbi:MAG: putative quinol monooxygenase [Pseudomonadota bacterium]